MKRITPASLLHVSRDFVSKLHHCSEKLTKSSRGPLATSRMLSLNTNSGLLLLLGALVLAVPVAETTECYPCQDRQKQTKILENCTNTEDDCEGCVEGLQEYSWTPYSFCGPKGITFVDNDTDVSLGFGSPAVLRCQFDVAVNCIWQKDDFQVEFPKFVIDSNGTNTTDCSIGIEGGWENAGTWDCKSLAEADKDAIQGSRVVVTLTATVTEVPQNASFHQGQNGTLGCQFNVPVSCFWQHNGTRITELGDRIHYVDGSGNGQNTLDCRIDISDFRDEDAGEWRCGCQGSSSLEETVSAAAWLTKLTENSQESNQTPEWAIVLAVIGTIGAVMVVISVVLGCVYGCGKNYRAVSQTEYELGETNGKGRAPVLMRD